MHLLNWNTAPIHLDGTYVAITEFGKPAVNSTFAVTNPQTRQRHRSTADSCEMKFPDVDRAKHGSQ
jgi:hypothetical protein